MKRRVLLGRALVLIVAVLCVGAAVSAAELMPNGGFEEKSAWYGTGIGSATVPKTVEATTAEKHSGQASLHIVIARGGQEWPGAISPGFPTETGKTYRVSFWAKVAKGSGGVSMRNGANNDYVPFFTGQLTSPVWTEYTGTYEEKNGGSAAFLMFSAVGDFVDVYVDDISITEMNTSREAILGAWRAVSPKQDYLIWQKASPWDNLQALQEAPESPKECTKIRLAMGRNEYESTSFVITNLTDQPQEFSVSLGASKPALTLRLATWITAFSGRQVDDALPLLEGPVSIPSGESREVWVTLNSRGVSAGENKATIKVVPEGGRASSIELATKVYPTALPEDKPIYSYYWDLCVPSWVAKSPGKAEALMLDLKKHYTNVAVTHPWSCPRLACDASGKLVTDYKELDEALENYKILSPKMILFNWGVENFMESGVNGGTIKYMSDEWKPLFKQWLVGWVKHMKEKGYGYEKYAMYPYDESLRPAVCDLVRLTKEVDPNVQVYVNNTGENEQNVTNIAPYVDIWCPYLYDYLNNPPYDGNRETKKLANQLLKKSRKNFWTYANPPGSNPEEAPPYRDYRLAPWKAWNEGMMGYGYWIYSYKTHWNSYKHEDGPNWAVVYFSDAPDAPAGISKKEIVVTGKRWEATREGMEDIFYLQMLKSAVSGSTKGKNPGAVKRGKELLSSVPEGVLANENNSSLAGAAKEAVLGVLGQLGVGK